MRAEKYLHLFHTSRLRQTDRQTDVLLTLTFRVLTGSLSKETVRGKITSSVRTTGSSRGD